ncbi:unnamed protein product [Amoebophrya sp. A120]|nr:unnamed protein product [Amoebophrya sp. A120]|eukprot:GSA120T00011789001.1
MVGFSSLAFVFAAFAFPFAALSTSTLSASAAENLAEYQLAAESSKAIERPPQLFRRTSVAQLTDREATVSALGWFPFGGRTRAQRERLYDALYPRREPAQANVGPRTTSPGTKKDESRTKHPQVIIVRKNDPHLPPVVFVHGMIGSGIMANLSDRKERKHFFCAKNGENYTLWFDPKHNLLPFEFDCWADNLSLHWKTQSGSADLRLADEDLGLHSFVPERSRPLGLDVPPLLAGGIGAWNTLLWGNLTEKLGYDNRQAGVVAYDWRKGPEEFAADGTFVRVQQTIEYYYKHNENTKVALLSISMGCPFLLWFLHWVDRTRGEEEGKRWKDTYLEVWVSLSGVFAGAPEMVSEALMPTDRDVYGITTKKPFSLYITKQKIRDIVGTWSGPLGMLPQSLDDRVVLWVTSKQKEGDAQNMTTSTGAAGAFAIGNDHSLAGPGGSDSPKMRTQVPGFARTEAGRSTSTPVAGLKNEATKVKQTASHAAPKVVPYRGRELQRAFEDAGRPVSAQLWATHQAKNWTDLGSPGVNLECMYGVNVPTEIGWVYGQGFGKSPTEVFMENETQRVLSSSTVGTTARDQTIPRTSTTRTYASSQHHPHHSEENFVAASGDGVVNLLSLDHCRYLYQESSKYVKVTQYDGLSHTDLAWAPGPFDRIMQVLQSAAEKNAQITSNVEKTAAVAAEKAIIYI